MLAAANPLLRVLCLAIFAYEIVLFVRVLSSWIPPGSAGPFRPLFTLAFDVTEPVLAPLRRLIPPARAGMVALDLSVVVLFVILLVLQQVICF